MKPLKVIIFAGYYFPHHGGYVESIHRLAFELKKRGHEVIIATCQLKKKHVREETIDGIKVLRFPCWHILKGTYPIVIPGLRTWLLLRRLKKMNVDIVSTQTRFFTTSFFGALFALWNRKPLIHTERGAYHSIVESKFVYRMSHLVDHTMGFFVVRRAKANVGVSQAATDFLDHLGAKNTHLIHNGVDIIPKLSEHEKTTFKKEFGFKESDRILLFVGRLIYAKGLQDILKNWTELLKKEPHLKLVIVGDGPYRKVLEKSAKHATFTRSIPAKEVVSYLQIANFFVNPSHSEGLPRSVLEAASAGLPIVATDIGGTNEIIKDEESGLLVTVKDSHALQTALNRIIQHPDLAQKFGKNAQKTAEKRFDWDKITKSYIDLFNQVL